MEYSEDHIALAAEYALGTLEADERAQVESKMAADGEFAAIVQAWEFRLGVLNQMVGSVEPPPELWERIRAAVAVGSIGQEPPPIVQQEPQESPPIVLPEALQPPLPPPPSPPPPPPEIELRDEFTPPPPQAAGTSNVIEVSQRAKAYRNLAAAMTAIAAVLLAIIGVQALFPRALPGLGGKPRVEVAEVKTKPTPTPAPSLAPSAQYVALLQGAAGGPAFILTVDGATKNFTVRKAGAPPIDPGKSYELWLISDKLQNRPRSLGVIGASDFTSRPLLADYASDVINSATYAVTIEQAGGSPDGAPHSQPVYIGRLIETVPAR